MGFKRSRVQIPAARFHFFTCDGKDFLVSAREPQQPRWCPLGAFKPGAPAVRNRARMRTEYKTANESLESRTQSRAQRKACEAGFLTAPRWPDLPVNVRARKDRQARLTCGATRAEMAVRYQNPVRAVAPRDSVRTYHYPKRQSPCHVI